MADGGFIANNTLNYVYPPRKRPPLPDRDARDYALRRLREFLAALIFHRTGAPGEPAIQFRVPKLSIHIHQPDDVKDQALPGFGMIPGQGLHEAFGLGPPLVIDGTEDIYGPGTALVRQSDYTEVFTLECWGSKHAERRALMAGVKAALRQNDGSYAIRLTLPEYFNETAEFSFDESLYIDGDEVARNRRRGHLYIKLQVREVALVNVVPLHPQLITTNAEAGIEVLDGNVYPRLDCP